MILLNQPTIGRSAGFQAMKSSRYMVTIAEWSNPTGARRGHAASAVSYELYTPRQDDRPAAVRNRRRREQSRAKETQLFKTGIFGIGFPRGQGRLPESARFMTAVPWRTAL